MASVVFDASGIPVDRVETILTDAGLQLEAGHQLRRTRFDTFDARLHRAGLQLEGRTVATSDHHVVVTGGGGPPAQRPLAQPLDPAAPVPLDALPPGPLQARLRATAADRAVLPQVTAVCHRRSATLTDADGIPRVIVRFDTDIRAEVPTTVPTVPAARAPSQPSRSGVEGDAGGVRTTIEVEALPGHDRAAERLQRSVAMALRATDGPASPHDGDTLTLTAAALGVDLCGWQGPARPDLDRRVDALVGMRAVLRSFAGALDASWDGAAEHLDDEFLHDLRIAVRQTRSLLAEGCRILPKEGRAEQRAAFRWLGVVTSPARDLDVYVAGWGELTALLDDGDARALDPVLAHLAGQRAVAHGEMARTLRSPAARRLRDRWRSWLDLPDHELVGGRDATEPLGRVIGARIVAAQEQLLADGRRIDEDSPGSQLHELRKDGKRLRYLLEGFGELGGKPRSKAVIGHLKSLQDNLGAHQDAEVQADRLRRTLDELAATAERQQAVELPPETVAAGRRLAAALRERQATQRAAFHGHFAAYDRKQARRTLAELVERMSR